MFYHPITLILGAGASVTYGYPVGSKLRDDILELSPNELAQGFQNGGYNDEMHVRRCTRFLEEFREAPNTSIDSFLETRINDSFVEIGKLAISRVLLPCEDVALLQGGWYQLLFNKMIANSEGAERLTVVTFNYDRSLEAFLHKAYKKAFGINDLEASKRLNASVDFIHVYGLLGEVEDFENPKTEQRCYGANGQEHLLSAANGLRLVSRNHEDPAGLFGRAQKALASADYRAILGFGFDEQNVKRLALQELEGGVIFCSGYGIHIGHRFRLRNECKGVSFNFGHASLETLEYLQQTDLLGWAASKGANSADLYAAMQPWGG